jgi:hypothetical protein
VSPLGSRQGSRQLGRAWRRLYGESPKRGGSGEQRGRAGPLLPAGAARGLMLWLTAALPSLLWCPLPEQLAPLGLDRLVASTSQAAALSDEQQLVSVGAPDGLELTCISTPALPPTSLLCNAASSILMVIVICDADVHV